MPAVVLRGYYAILNLEGSSVTEPAALVRRAEELLAAGPCCLQLRAKRLSAAALRDAAAAVLPSCRAAAVPFCINDRVDVALSAGADVVHVGQEDLPLDVVRHITGGRVAVGVSTHDEAQAVAAAEAGADYIAFGPIFGTRTKERPDPTVGLEALRRITRLVRVPVVAIGGITLETVALVAAAGARAAAVISAVDEAPDRTAAGRQVAAAFAGAPA